MAPRLRPRLLADHLIQRVVLRRRVVLHDLGRLRPPLFRPVPSSSNRRSIVNSHVNELSPRKPPATERPHECILHELLDFVAGAATHGEPREGLGMALDQQCRCLVARLPSRDELRILLPSRARPESVIRSS